MMSARIVNIGNEKILVQTDGCEAIDIPENI